MRTVITIAAAFFLLVGCANLHRESGNVLVIGASSGTGLEVVKALVAQGEHVTAFVRPTSKRDELARLNVDYAVGDATNEADVRVALTRHRVRAVISTLGGRPNEPRPDLIGNKVLVDAAKAVGVRRVILVTVIGAGDSTNALPERVRQSLAGVIPLKTESEAYLTASGLDYTIIRPGGLTNAPDGGRAALTLDHTGNSSISRAELARLIVGALRDSATIGKIYHAIDPGNGGRN